MKNRNRKTQTIALDKWDAAYLDAVAGHRARKPAASITALASQLDSCLAICQIENTASPKIGSRTAQIFGHVVEEVDALERLILQTRALDAYEAAVVAGVMIMQLRTAHNAANDDEKPELSSALYDTGLMALHSMLHGLQAEGHELPANVKSWYFSSSPWGEPQKKIETVISLFNHDGQLNSVAHTA